MDVYESKFKAIEQQLMSRLSLLRKATLEMNDEKNAKEWEQTLTGMVEELEPYLECMGMKDCCVEVVEEVVVEEVAASCSCIDIKYHLNTLTIVDLKALCKRVNIKGYSNKRKLDIVNLILAKVDEKGCCWFCEVEKELITQPRTAATKGCKVIPTKRDGRFKVKTGCCSNCAAVFEYTAKDLTERICFKHCCSYCRNNTSCFRCGHGARVPGTFNCLDCQWI